jgi:D-glycero-alpha-D-manno-heptose-7-phosphate kinase
VLCFTGIARTSSEVAASYAPSLGERQQEQTAMMKLAEDGLAAIYKKDWSSLGSLMDNAWRIKRGLSPQVSNKQIDDIYAAARLAGAAGGKVTGAGGGGCMLFVLKDVSREGAVKKVLQDAGCVLIDFKFEHDGAKVIFSNGEDFKCDRA